MSKLILVLHIVAGFVIGVWCATSFTPKFKIGQTVTNGFCTGMVIHRDKDVYTIDEARCGDTTFLSSVFIHEQELKLAKNKEEN